VGDEILFGLGAFFQFSGVILVASPDLVPGARRASDWARQHWRPIENAIRRALRLPPRRRNYYLDAGAGTITLSAGRVSAIAGTSATSIEDQVAFLLRRDRDTQEAINRLAERDDEIAESLRTEVAAAREDLTRHVSTAITAALAEYRPVRIGGVAALVIGLVLLSIATFPS
jgi:hypothetical protein